MITAVIPAHLASQRLPRKLLLPDKSGKPLLYHTWSNIRSAKSVNKVVIATSDIEILMRCSEFGARCFLTGLHSCGTDRIAEYALTCRLKPDDIIINIQGDEPEIGGELIDLLISNYREELIQSTCLATLATQFGSNAEYQLPQNVKVIIADGKAVRFGRSPIPGAYKHIGVYAYSVDTLQKFSGSPQSREECEFKLEQYRAISNSWPIMVALIQSKRPGWPVGINTIEDYNAWLDLIIPS